MDVGPNGQTIWSVDTEYCESDSWIDPLVMITQEWDPTPFRMQKCERKSRLDLRAEQEAKPWYGQVYTGSQ